MLNIVWFIKLVFFSVIIALLLGAKLALANHAIIIHKNICDDMAGPIGYTILKETYQNTFLFVFEEKLFSNKFTPVGHNFKLSDFQEFSIIIHGSIGMIGDSYSEDFVNSFSSELRKKKDYIVNSLRLNLISCDAASNEYSKNVKPSLVEAFVKKYPNKDSSKTDGSNTSIFSLKSPKPESRCLQFGRVVGNTPDQQLSIGNFGSNHQLIEGLDETYRKLALNAITYELIYISNKIGKNMMPKIEIDSTKIDLTKDDDPAIAQQLKSICLFAINNFNAKNNTSILNLLDGFAQNAKKSILEYSNLYEITIPLQSCGIESNTPCRYTRILK